MKSEDYRGIITKISFNLLRKRFPGLDKKNISEVARLIAIYTHARLYGANVDGVDSPIWTSAQGNDRMNDPRVKPQTDVAQMLKEILE